MTWIRYNGITSSELGMIVERISSAPPPVRQYEYYDVPGADGQIVIDNGTYEDVQIEVRLNFMSSSGATVSVVNSWLTGTGVLTISDEPLRYYKVKAVQNNTRYRRRLRGDNYDSIYCIFVCDPYRYVVDSSVITPTVSSHSATITNSYNAPALPKITMTGTSPMTLILNGTQFTVAATGVILDFEAKAAYYGNPATSKNNVITLLDVWPSLKPGSNTLTWSNSVSTLSIDPRWREL